MVPRGEIVGDLLCCGMVGDLPCGGMRVPRGGLGAEDACEAREGAGPQPVVRPRGATFALYEAGIQQHLEVVAHCGLREVHRIVQVTDASTVLTCGGDHRQQADARGVSERLEDARGDLGLFLADGVVHQRGAARLESVHEGYLDGW